MATTAPKAPKGAAFKPTLVHAYRRAPHMKLGANGVDVEAEVEVVFDGERVKFKSNEAGHIVGLVKSEATFNRLVNEIPEAYIAYADGDNVPERTTPTGGAPIKPAGDFVLASGDGEFMVLDGKDDAELRAFGLEAGLEAEQLPEALTGDTLRRAIFNLLTQ